MGAFSRTQKLLLKNLGLIMLHYLVLLTSDHQNMSRYLLFRYYQVASVCIEDEKKCTFYTPASEVFEHSELDDVEEKKMRSDRKPRRKG